MSGCFRGISPYIVGSPIREPSSFYGRRDLAARLFAAVFGQQLSSISVLGARRTGKTSFLTFVENNSTLCKYLGPRHKSVVPVFFDLQANITSVLRFYEQLMELTTRVLENYGEARFHAPKFTTDTHYHSLVEEFFDGMCRKGWRFLILLDEFEQLLAHDVFDENFFSSLRALAGVRDVAWVTASFRDIYQLEKKAGFGAGSPFFNIFHPVPIYVGALSEEEARQLITRPAEKAGHPFTDEDVTFILTMAGRLPFAIQAAASMLYQADRSGKTSKSVLGSTREEFYKAMRKHFSHNWAHFTSTERQALLKLVQAGELTSEDHEALRDLANYGFVEEIHRNYRILGDAFTEWISSVASQAA